ncbi:MAG: mechanosensitive ion channel family protein [Bryobacterales bacterium]|nr:mechanosensitive ion channel family protein [Acidobacteriota bacterium]MCB9384701.1 mechanosensitive ion channel family protein [Bryobacterales bacterium]
MDQWNEWLSPEMLSQITDYAVRVVGVLLLLIVARIVAGWVARGVVAGLERAKFDRTLTKFFGNLARYAILVMAVLACLGVFGVETTSFAAVVAAAGFAVGLAFQGTLSNFSSGVMLLTFRPFELGDYIVAGGQEGIVDEIGLFTTTLHTLDNRKVIVPNSAIASGVIENYTAEPLRRVDVNVGVEYSSDLRKVRQVLDAVVEAEPQREEGEKSYAYLVELADSSINWQLRVWAKPENYWGVRERVTQAAKEALDSAGIGIPFPQMDVHMKNAA